MVSKQKEVGSCCRQLPGTLLPAATKILPQFRKIWLNRCNTTLHYYLRRLVGFELLILRSVSEYFVTTKPIALKLIAWLHLSFFLFIVSWVLLWANVLIHEIRIFIIWYLDPHIKEPVLNGSDCFRDILFHYFHEDVCTIYLNCNK